jgi:hypothetical protein
MNNEIGSHSLSRLQSGQKRPMAASQMCPLGQRCISMCENARIAVSVSRTLIQKRRSGRWIRQKMNERTGYIPLVIRDGLRFSFQRMSCQRAARKLCDSNLPLRPRPRLVSIHPSYQRVSQALYPHSQHQQRHSNAPTMLRRVFTTLVSARG